jgi:hypothetical protein
VRAWAERHSVWFLGGRFCTPPYPRALIITTGSASPFARRRSAQGRRHDHGGGPVPRLRRRHPGDRAFPLPPALTSYRNAYADVSAPL